MKPGSILLLSAAWIVLTWPAVGASVETNLDMLRVYMTEPACFEYMFTGVVSETEGQPLLSFNHQNGRTFFVKLGEPLGRYRLTAFESKPKRVFNPSINAYLEEPERVATLAGPAGETLTLRQDQRLPWPGRVAWLIRLDNGLWWNVQEQDVFLIGDTLAAVEEIDEAEMVVTFGQDLRFINLISTEEKNTLNRLWAERQRQEQQARELALQRQREAAQQKTENAGAYVSVAPERGPHIEIRGPSKFFYGTEYRFPAAFKAYPCVQYVNGQPVQSYIVLPTRFETRTSGVSMIGQ